MKLKSKLIAAAIAMAAASGANAAIDAGVNAATEGSGELFFNIWDANGSYTFDLNLSIASFQSAVSGAGLIDLTYAADTTLIDFFAGTSAAGARSGPLMFNVTANDGVGSGTGARRTFQTFTEPAPLTTIGSGVARNVNGATNTYINNLNAALGANNSVAVDSASSAYTGLSFKDKAGNFLNFSNAGTLANNSYATGLSFMSIGANSIGTSASTYTQLLDSGSEIHVYLDNANALHISAVAAIPEPSEYALMLAGLGMLGFMARRRLNNRA